MKRKYYHPIFGEILLPKTAPDSAKIRSKRRDEKKRKKAQESALDHVDLGALMEAQIAGKITGPEMQTITLGSAPEIKKALREVQIRTGVGASPWFPPAELTPIENPQTPSHVVRDKNAPSFRSWLVEPEPPSLSSSEEIYEEFHRRRKNNESPHRLVDLLAAVTPMTWLQSRAVVRDVLERPDVVPDEILKLVVQARLFWIGLREYRKLYENAVAARFIRTAAGHWLFVNARDLTCFLPGLNVPKMHSRTAFLISVDRSAKQLGTKLSFYSTRYKPLFQVVV